MDGKTPTLLERLRNERERAKLDREPSERSVTKWELEALEAQREKPKREQHYTIGGNTEQVVHEKLSGQREGRIDAIRTRLAEVREKVKERFSAHRGRGHSKTDFDRSR